MNEKPIIVWFRRDLRLRDNPALQAALERGGAVLPVYIHDEAGEGDWPDGGASKWWLHHSLKTLGASLRERESRLILRKGKSEAVLQALIEETGATAVYWNRRYEPAILARDEKIEAALTASAASSEVEVRHFNSALLFEPNTIVNKQGKPYQVFTPYWRYCQSREIEPPVKLKSGAFTAPSRWPASDKLDDWALLPRIAWDKGFHDTWTPGEEGAQKQLKRFLAEAIEDYSDARNTPSVRGTSHFSPHLHFGELGPRQIWAAVRALSKDSGIFPPSPGAQVFLTEIGWREFAHHLLVHFPQTPKQPLREKFGSFPWASDPQRKKLLAWQRGLTGYPIVDAGMRELWRTGWMHNRVRMIVASFLVKHLRLSWTHGAEWFWDTLVDADLANNTLGWQWSAGCGADAAPYFRIFAPVTQGEKFDGGGDYVRRWVPEIARLPKKYLHAPWTAPAEVLERAGVVLGASYPKPVVDHGEARKEALAAFKSL